MAQFETHKHLIHWSRAGDHDGEDPKEVVADEYTLADGFYTFIVWTTAFNYDTVLSVRASDVSMIEMGEPTESPAKGMTGPRRG